MKNHTRQSPSVPVTTTGSPRSPQPDGSAHSPLPWVVDADGDRILTQDLPRLTVAFVCGGFDDDADIGPTTRANAKFIATACNNHADLVTALRGLLGAIATDELIPESVSYMRQARAAIAKAEGR